MNDQVPTTAAPIFNGAPDWLTLPFALIALGVLFALFILFWGTRLAGRRRDAREEVEEYNQEYAQEARPITAPVAPPPPPLAEPPLVPPAPVAEPAPEPVAPQPAPEPEPEPEPIADELPSPEPLADEPIAAAAPLDASPASLASDVAEPAHAEPVAPEPAVEPAAPAAPAADDLTRMKGVGPRLAERLNSVGITSFAQIAAMTPAEADALDARLGDFQGRIHRDRWIEQAGFLAAGDIAGFEATFGKL